MRKKALLAVLMAAVLLLSGCTLIVKDQAVDNATEIIRMGDRVVTKKEVKEQVDSVLQYNEYMYSMMGQSYDVTDPQVIASAQEEAIDDLKKDLTLTAKAKELGLPIYMVLQQKALLAIAAHRPVTPKELAMMNGVGPVTIERYGKEILDIVADFNASGQ